MKNNKTSRIDTYETPYEVYLVVANKYATLDELKEQFIFANGDELDNSLLENEYGKYVATTATCLRKSDNRPVVLVKHVSDSKIKNIDKLLDIINAASHEACHVILDIYDSRGVMIDYQNQELFAYEQAWITSNILKTWLNR